MSSITNYTREEIKQGLEKSRKKNGRVNDQIRILFAPNTIDDDNFDRVCDIYSRLESGNYDTVVIVEVHNEVLDKKLPMASNRSFQTPLGSVPVDDYMRNEFCDEDDDFFVYDEAFSKDISLFQQLMMLQVQLDDFKALSVQIADESHFIVKELAYVLEEVLASRNALIVFCCDLESDRKKEFNRVKEMIESESYSSLLNYLNSGESHISGTAAFIAGVIVAKEWGMRLNFVDDTDGNSLLTAYADRERVAY